MNCERCDDDREAFFRIIAEKDGETVEELLCGDHCEQRRAALEAKGFKIEREYLNA